MHVRDGVGRGVLLHIPLRPGDVAGDGDRAGQLVGFALQLTGRLDRDRLVLAEDLPTRPRLEELPHLHGQGPHVVEADQRIQCERRHLGRREDVDLPPEGLPVDLRVVGRLEYPIGGFFHVAGELLGVAVHPQPKLVGGHLDVGRAAYQGRLRRWSRRAGGCQDGGQQQSRMQAGWSTAARKTEGKAFH